MIALGEYALPISAAFGLLTFSLMLRQPVIGLVLAWTILVLVPYGSFRLPLPIFDSPLMIVASLTLVLGFGHLVTKKERVLSSNVYIPMGLWAGVLILFALIEHGPDAATRAQWTLQGTWGFFLVILVVRTPYHARSVVLALLVPFVALALLWLPAMLTTGGLSLDRSGDYVASSARHLWAISSTQSSPSYRLLDLFGTGAWQTFTLMAMVWPVIFSFALNGSHRFWRLVAGIISIALFVTILLSSYGNAAIIVIEGVLFVLLFSLRKSPLRIWIFAILLVGALGALILFTSSGQAAIQRVLSGSDPSLVSREVAWQHGLRAFASNPLMGWGAYNYAYITPSGYYLLGHGSFIPAAYEYGLIYLIPMAILLGRLGLNVFRLGQKARSQNDRAAVIGIQALFLSYIVQGFISGSMGIIGIDSVFWLCMGLVTVWLHWSESEMYHGLIG